LRDRAEKGGLTQEHFEGGTFSITNVGNLGGTYLVPTILRPQGAIMGFGRAKKNAKYVADPKSPDGYKFVPQDIVKLFA